MARRVYLFDFDGTITRGDTFVKFIYFAKGRVVATAIFLRYSLQLLLMKMGIADNDALKQKIFSSAFKGMKIDEFDDLCRQYADSYRHIIIPSSREYIDKIEGDSDIYIVTASIENWVKPFFPDKAITVIATKVEVDDNHRLTGRFDGRNCNRREKKRRILEAIPDISQCEVTAFGNSAHDNEMLSLADHKHFMHFK